MLYSPSNCAKYSHKIKTVKDVLKLPSKSLGDFKSDYGRDWVIAYVSMWIIELNDNSSVKTKMSDAQIEFTAIRIFEGYSLKVTDLTLFFRNIKEGAYGQFYESLSSEKIMEWLRKYFDLRCEYAQMESQSNTGHSILKDGLDPEVSRIMFQGVGEKKVEHNHKKNPVGARINANLITSIKTKDTNYLKSYLVENDVNSDTYDSAIYTLIEKELDLRNKNN